MRGFIQVFWLVDLRESLGFLVCGLGTSIGSRVYFLRLAFEGLCLGHLAGGLGTFRLFEWA